MQRQALKRVRGQGAATEQTASATASECSAAMRWLHEAQHAMQEVSDSLQEMAGKMAAENLAIPHTKFDATVDSIRPVHQLLQLIMDLPPAALVSLLHPLWNISLHASLSDPRLRVRCSPLVQSLAGN